MVDWLVTAKTVYCDNVNDEVTIIVKKDWSIQCTGNSRYYSSAAALNKPSKRTKEMQRKSGCEGMECRRVIQYKEQLLNEESQKA